MLELKNIRYEVKDESTGKIIYPPMVVIIEITDKGEYEVTYLKEEKSEEKDEFIWERNKEKNNEILIAKDKVNTNKAGDVISKPDALEDIIDMDNNKDAISEVIRD